MLSKEKKINTKPRNASLDGLRTIGLLAIILAHVAPPDWLFQIRNFDVPLMILVSGSVFNISSGAKKNYSSYFLNRVGRLLIPTWIFLAIFFTIVGLITKFASQTFPYSLNTIISSFDLTIGVGYVWIIRVFILVAIALPFLVRINEKLRDKSYLFFLFITYLCYELVFIIYSSNIVVQNIPVLNFIFQNILFYLIPYGIIAGIGLYITKLNNKKVGLLALIFVAIFLILDFNFGKTGFIPTQNFKYPPRLYYISYALTFSFVLYIVSRTKMFQKIFENRILSFISSSSLWIFLWQILFLFIWSEIKRFSKTPLLQNFLTEYIFVIILSVLITYLQKLIFQKVVDKLNDHDNLGKFLYIAFLK